MVNNKKWLRLHRLLIRFDDNRGGQACGYVNGVGDKRPHYFRKIWWRVYWSFKENKP